MVKHKPRVAVFFGGSADNYDLSQETGRWVNNAISREKFDVIPIHVTSQGEWQVPLGSLPRQGQVNRVLDMFQAALPALPPAQAMPRLLSREPDVFFSLLRGAGGDDGSLQQLARTVGAAAVGSSPAVCLTTADKSLCARALAPVVLTPFSVTVPQSLPPMEAAARIASGFSSAVFVKPAIAEGSVGVSRIEQAAELPAAIAAVQKSGNVLIQEAHPGTELSVTVYQDEAGLTQTLPPTEIHPGKAQFFDSLAKRHAGRVTLTTGEGKSSLLRRATDLAREIYATLQARGALAIDMVAHGDNLDLLEVNTVPVASAYTPLTAQLKAAGMHPTLFVDSLVRSALSQH